MPDIAEQTADYRAWAEGLRAAKALPKGHLLKLVRVQREESEQYYKELRALWSYWWQLWLSEVDFGEKEPWQTQIWIPKPFTSVEQATGLVQASLLESPDAFGIDGEGEENKTLATRLWTPWITKSLEGAHFVEKYTDAIKVGFMAGVTGYLKWRWQRGAQPVLVGAEMDQEAGRLRPIFRYDPRNFIAIDHVMPWNVWRCPGSKPREMQSGSYMIHGEFKARAETRAMVRAGWDKDAVERFLASKGGTGAADTGTTTSLQAEAARRQQSAQPSEFRQPQMVYEYWGHILDQNGDPVFADGLLHVGGENHLLFGPDENPLWAVDIQTGHRKWPLLAAAPLVHPSRFEGRGLIEQTADMNRLYSGTFCMLSDGMNWMVNPEREVNQDALADFNDLGVFPGKTWITKKMEQSIRQVGVRIPVGEILAFLQFLGQQQQNSDFVTDFAIGLPGARSNITATEATQKRAQSLSIFQAIGRNLETLGREGVELTRDFLCQYASDFNDPGLAEILGPANAAMLASMPPAERFNLLVAGEFSYRFTGVSQALEKEQQLGRIVQFGQLAASDPYLTLIGAQAPMVYLQILHVVRDVLGLGDKITLPDPAQQPMAPAAPTTIDPRTGQPVTPNTPAELLAARGVPV